MLEVWKSVAGCGYYQVSSQGQVRRIVGRRGLPGKTRVLKPSGVVYPNVNLHNGGGPKSVKTCSVHRLVWIAFHGPIEEGLEINHKDRNKWNCALDNLELVTPQQNIHHAIAKGVHYGFYPGEGHTKAKLTWEQVQAIRKTYALHKPTQSWLSKQFGVSRSNIQKILSGKSWEGGN